MQIVIFLYQYGAAIIGLMMLMYLLMSKRKFLAPEEKLSNRSKKFLYISAALLSISLISFFGFIYYQSYFPDYGYDDASKQINFHIYQPKIIPRGRTQSSRFHLADSKVSLETLEKYPAAPKQFIRSFYSYPVRFGAAVIDNPKLVAVNQIAVDSNFEILKYLESLNEDRELNIQEIQLNSDKVRVAYTEQSADSIITQLWLITDDNVLIGFISPGPVETISQRIDDFVIMAESLE